MSNDFHHKKPKKQQPSAPKNRKSYELLFVQFLSAIGVAWFGFRRVLTTGEANRVFFGLDTPAAVLVPTIESRMPPLKPLVLTENYFSLALEGRFGDAVAKLEPMQVVQDYVAQHSNEVLEREWAACERNGADKTASCFDDRNFLVTAYACPHYAGRRLHTFMNGLIWSIATNRTFLWFYMDDAQCHLQEDAWGASDCNRNNTQEDCDSYLIVSDWMASLDQWKDRLQLHNKSQIVRANFAKRDEWARPYDQPNPPRFLTHGQQPSLLTGVDLTRPNQRDKLLVQPENRLRARNLFWYGYYFTYGMLQEILFTLKGDEYVPAAKSSHAHRTYAFHSRHGRPALRREYDGLERTCIAQLGPLGRNSTVNTPDGAFTPNCTVYMMLDNHDRYECSRNILTMLAVRLIAFFIQ